MLLMMDNKDNWEWPFEDSQVSFDVKVGLSNRQADLDNIIKPCLDTYQSMYADFNDNKVYYVQLEKFIVKKGEEYLDVTITEYSDN